MWENKLRKCGAPVFLGAAGASDRSGEKPIAAHHTYVHCHGYDRYGRRGPPPPVISNAVHETTGPTGGPFHGGDV